MCLWVGFLGGAAVYCTSALLPNQRQAGPPPIVSIHAIVWLSSWSTLILNDCLVTSQHRSAFLFFSLLTEYLHRISFVIERHHSCGEALWRVLHVMINDSIAAKLTLCSAHWHYLPSLMSSRIKSRSDQLCLCTPQEARHDCKTTANWFGNWFRVRKILKLVFPPSSDVCFSILSPQVRYHSLMTDSGQEAQTDSK